MMTMEVQLIDALGDTPETQRFIGWVLPTLREFDAKAGDWLPRKMKRSTDDYQQIEAVYKQAKKLTLAIDALGEDAKARLASSGWWDQDRTPQDLYDLMFSAGLILDQQSLKHGEKQTLDGRDIVRVRIIAQGFKTFLGRGPSKSDTSVFSRAVSILLDLEKSPEALIESACRMMLKNRPHAWEDM